MGGHRISWDEKYIVVNSIPLQHIAHRTSVYCQRSFQRSNRTDKQNSADIKLTGWRGNCMGGKARQGNRIPLRGFNSDACQPTLVPCLRQDEHVASPDTEYISSISLSNNYVVDDALAGGSQLRATTDRRCADCGP